MRGDETQMGTLLKILKCFECFKLWSDITKMKTERKSIMQKGKSSSGTATGDGLAGINILFLY
jgi:hypothetical protein